MIENVIKALTGVGFEEEKDSMAESGSSEGEQVVDLHITVHPTASIDLFKTAASQYGSQFILDVANSESEVSTPPPKIS